MLVIGECWEGAFPILLHVSILTCYVSICQQNFTVPFWKPNLCDGDHVLKCHQYVIRKLLDTIYRILNDYSFYLERSSWNLVSYYGHLVLSLDPDVLKCREDCHAITTIPALCCKSPIPVFPSPSQPYAKNTSTLASISHWKPSVPVLFHGLCLFWGLLFKVWNRKKVPGVAQVTWVRQVLYKNFIW